jgi:hypothetical protein
MLFVILELAFILIRHSLLYGLCLVCITNTTPWSKGLLEKLTVSQLVKKFPARLVCILMVCGFVSFLNGCVFCAKRRVKVTVKVKLSVGTS